MLVLDADAVRASCAPTDAVAAIERVLTNGFDPAGDLERVQVPLRNGQFLLMPSQGFCAGFDEDPVGVKVVTVAPRNGARGMPRIQGLYLLFDGDTLSPKAVLDGSALTTLRTPAVSVAATRARLLSTPTQDRSLRIVVFGAGPQALAHVDTLTQSLTPHRDIAAIHYLVREPDRVRAAADPDRRPIAVLQIGTAAAETALREAGVIVCATSAQRPLFDSNLLSDNATVIAIGSHQPSTREIDSALCRRAVVVVEDIATALREAGDVVMAVADGSLRPDSLVTMNDVVTGRTHLPEDRPALFKSVGMSWQDLAVAQAVVARFRRSQSSANTLH